MGSVLSGIASLAPSTSPGDAILQVAELVRGLPVGPVESATLELAPTCQSRSVLGYRVFSPSPPAVDVLVIRGLPKRSLPCRHKLDRYSTLPPHTEEELDVHRLAKHALLHHVYEFLLKPDPSKICASLASVTDIATYVAEHLRVYVSFRGRGSSTASGTEIRATPSFVTTFSEETVKVAIAPWLCPDTAKAGPFDMFVIESVTLAGTPLQSPLIPAHVILGANIAPAPPGRLADMVFHREYSVSDVVAALGDGCSADEVTEVSFGRS